MANTTADLTATGSATLTKPGTDTLTFCQISGTYGTVQFQFEGSIDATNFFPLAAIKYDTGAVVNGTIAPTDNTTRTWKVPSEGLVAVRAKVTAIASGTASFALSSASYIGLPFTVNQTTTGSTVASTQFTGDVTISGGSDILFTTGTTGQTEISLVDNLADALSLKIAGGNDLMVFTSTDSAESVTITPRLNLLDVGTVAAAGSSQGTSTAIANMITSVSASDGAKGVVLPTAAAGKVYLIYNSVASQALKIYPASSGTINGGSANVAVSQTGKTFGLFVAYDATNWMAVYS